MADLKSTRTRSKRSEAKKDWSHDGRQTLLRQTESERHRAVSGSSHLLEEELEKDEEVIVEEEEEDEEKGGDRKISEIREGIAHEDVEAGSSDREKRESSLPTQDPNLITWEGPSDGKNPRNWSLKRKWSASIFLSFFAFISTIASSMISPAINSICTELGMGEVEGALSLSIFLLAFAIGSLVLGPLSEIYGRVIVIQVSGVFFLSWNLGCGFAQSPSQLMTFRFMSGLGASSSMAIGGAVLGDCFLPEQRGLAMSVYSLMPMIGPAIGPIAGGFVAQNTTWRWCFWSTSIFSGILQCFGFVLLQETYAPKILAWKRDALIKETGNIHLRTEYDHPEKTPLKIIIVALERPFILFGTQPIVQILAIYMAFVYGVMYLMLTTFPTLWEAVYHESTSIGSLNYISIAVGLLIGMQSCGRCNDAIYRYLKHKNNNTGCPEFRVPMMIPGSLLVPIGLFWYGWSAQAGIHWIMPNIGAAIFCIGTIVEFQCIQTYIVDTYTLYAASAVSVTSVLRSLAAFGFPLFAPAMLNALEYGWGNSLLAFFAIALSVPAPLMLWKIGARLRAKSQFAARR